MMHEGWILEASPFHPGEQAIQEKLGRREEMERFGRRVIRPYMPDQHRDFYASLPFAAIGAMDAQGRPWAGLVFGAPGFLKSPEPRELSLGADFHPDDPIGFALDEGAPIGLLGVELASRRRNRVNGRVVERDGSRRVIAVDQSFGNCPQYNQNRALVETLPAPPQPAIRSAALSDEDRAMIAAADTFFVASATPSRDQPWEGVDVSHRGGRPGFVKVEGDQLTVPDYTGNFYFNTLGNFAVYPRAGLVFVDF
jgi:predicted pyridoxine 5'-phosphate oxidase superfamily flavin-nucleotide-binding protein